MKQKSRDNPEKCWCDKAVNCGLHRPHLEEHLQPRAWMLHHVCANPDCAKHHNETISRRGIILTITQRKSIY